VAESGRRSPEINFTAALMESFGPSMSSERTLDQRLFFFSV
jgi:hypothetical protein